MFAVSDVTVHPILIPLSRLQVEAKQAAQKALMKPQAERNSSTPAQGVVNLEGQLIGTRIDVTA